MRPLDLKNRLPSFWTIQLTGWTVYFVVIYISFLTIAQPENFASLLFLKGFRALTGFFLSSVFLRPIYKRFRKRFSITSQIFLVLGCAVVFSIVWTAIEAAYSFTTAVFNTRNYLARSPRIALDYAMTLTAWSALYLGIKNWLEWQTERENALQSAALAQKARLEMLRYQLNPHFLFNALNSIRASIDEDAARAKQMIVQISEFLRYSLLDNKEDKVPLHEELDAIRNYLSIEKIRFEDNLEIEYDVQEEVEDFELPCFLLNPLVENAIKHGMRSSSRPLRIKISASVTNRKLILEVQNSGNLNNSSDTNNTGIGLKNVRERLEKLSGEKGRFELKQDKDVVKARIEIFQ